MEIFAVIVFMLLGFLVNSIRLELRHPVSFIVHLSLVLFAAYFCVGYWGLFEIRKLHLGTIILYIVYVLVFCFGFLLTEGITFKYRISVVRTRLFSDSILIVLSVSVLMSIRYLNGLGYFIMDPSFYFKIRHAINYENLNLGILRLMPSLAIVNFLYSYRYIQSRSRVVFSFLLAVFFIYVNTGRTSLLLLLIGTLVVKSSKDGFKFQSALIPFVSLVLIFSLLGILSNKGGSLDSSLSENLISMASNIMGYAISPIAAFDYYLENSEPTYSLENTLRFPSALFSAIGYDFELAEIVQPFVKVPFSTNVYGLPHYYYSDMGAFYSVLVVLVFGFLFGFIYTKNTSNFLNIIFRVIIFYVLSMFYFQDQILSVLSMWLKILIWSFLYAKYSHSSL